MTRATQQSIQYGCVLPFSSPFENSSLPLCVRAIVLYVGLQRLFIRMRLELMSQLLDCFLADVIVAVGQPNVALLGS